MSRRFDGVFERLAAEVADDGHPDWDRQVREHSAEARAIGILRALADLATAHRNAHRASGGSDAAGQAVASHTSPWLTRSLPFDWGPFRVRELLGSGSDGAVFRAFDPRLERDVALKLTRGDETAATLTEARRLASVRHRNVLTIHGADHHDGATGYWTDLLFGRTLEQRISIEGAFGEAEAALIGIDLCRALRAVHEAGLVHGDVKPANVMQDDEGSVVLLDFGAARLLGGTRDESIRGTPLLAAPEVLSGRAATPTSDLYSLGVLLYRLTTLHYPIEVDSIHALVATQRAGGGIPLAERRPELSPAFRSTIERATRANPAERFPDAATFEAALTLSLDRETRPHDRSLSAPHNLPADPSRFIGREREIGQLKRMVASERLVTITGAAGSGKTRLALQVAHALRLGGMSEIRWIELAAVRRASGIVAAISAVLGIRGASGLPGQALLVERLRDRASLLLLDNCEHLVPGCGPLIRSLLQACPRLTILATSRERLGVSGEALYPLGALAEATNLFVDRAATAGTAIAMDARSGPLVQTICHRLDGLPLAIEIAAARTRGLALAQLLARLDDRLSLPSGEARGLPRHRTLSAAIEWSHDLLTRAERTGFRRLAVFSGGWSLEAAEAVLAGRSERAHAGQDLLARLIDKSLVECDRSKETARYRMLESIHAYARARLVASGEQARLTGRHRDHFIALAKGCAERLRTPDEGANVRRAEQEVDNLRAAYEECLEDSFPLERGLSFASDLVRLWHAFGRWSEGLELGQRMLARVPARRRASSALFDLNVYTGYLAVDLSRREEAAALFERGRALAEALKDRARLAVAYGYLGNLAITRGDLAEARRCQEQSLALNLEVGNLRRVGICHSNLGNIAEEMGDLVSARHHHEESLAAARQCGDLSSLGYGLGRLGDTNLIEGRYLDAVRCYEESRAVRESLGDRWGQSVALSGLGEAKLRLGQVEEAMQLQDEALALLRQVGDSFSLVRVLLRVASGVDAGIPIERADRCLDEALPLALSIEDRFDLASLFVLRARRELESGRYERAGTLLGAANRVLQESESVLNSGVEDLRRELHDRLERAVGQSEADAYLARGRAMSDAAAVEFALAPA